MSQSIKKWPMTDKQDAFYTTLKAYFDEHGTAPTHEELMKLHGLKAKANVTAYLNALEKRGWIERLPHAARGIRLL